MSGMDMSDLPPEPKVPRELWSEFWRRCWAEAGVSCGHCGCPVAWHTRIEGTSPDMVIHEGLRCLFCGRDYEL